MEKKEYQTSRERVLAALNFRTPDRIPIDLGGFQTGIHKKAYIELLTYLNLDEEIIILDPVPWTIIDLQVLAKVPIGDVIQQLFPVTISLHPEDLIHLLCRLDQERDHLQLVGTQPAQITLQRERRVLFKECSCSHRFSTLTGT